MKRKKRKYSRKELQQPDEFIVASTHAWEWTSTHVKGVVIMVAAALVVFVAVSLLRGRAEAQEKEATDLLDRAIEIQNQTVIPGAEKLPKSEDGMPRFSTQKAKLAAAIKEYDKLLAAYGDAGVGHLALLLRAGACFDAGQYDEAIKSYQAFLTKTGTDQGRFHTLAIEGLAYSYEAQKAWGKALSALGKLEKKGQARYAVIFQEARILAAKGDTAGAIQRYKEIVD
ncbi:MAG: tetratricopeptide repeat protein, partial [Deltaproteobacteria bacterium]|nr:tetratricopeptide repeat protein [Deltaproteobacteria bacterium]